MIVAFVATLSIFAEEVQVTVSVEATRNSIRLKKDLEKQAKKAAIKKYILKLNSQTPSKLIEEACNEYGQFASDVEAEDDPTWERTGNRSGQLKGDFKVEIDAAKLNSWLKEKGFSQQGGIELIIMEEPPSLGQIKVNEAFGPSLNGNNFFLQNYTVFQRNLRDAILKKVGTYGFDVKLLADNDLYEKFKSKDGTLVGVYFDVNNNNFTVDRDLLKTVKENNPDTLVLYYRVDYLIYNPTTKEISVTVAFNFKDLNTNVTKSIGSQTYQLITNGTQKDQIMRDFSQCAIFAMNSLMNAEGMAQKLNSIAMSIKNAANMPKGPIKLIVNASTFDKKIRKKAMYMLKKEMVSKKITSASKIKSSNTTLTATIDNPNIKAADELYHEHISPILEKMGIELDDDKVNLAGNTVTIRP